MPIEFCLAGGTPCYYLTTSSKTASIIHGATLDRDNNRWLFPAYAPFEERVFNDLTIAFKDTPWSTEALEQHARSIAAEEARLQGLLPAGFQFKTPPFDHQKEGLSFLYHRLRAGLLWAMGTGKSKVIVDLKRLLPDKRMLIVSPKVTLYNWEKEFRTHGEDTIRVGVIAGDLESKRAIIEDSAAYDVLVTSYGTARNLGFPVLHKKTLGALAEAKEVRTMSENAYESLIKVCRQVGPAEDQISLVKKWASGQTVADVRRLAEVMRKAAPQFLCDIDYDIIVADESHSLQSNTSDQTKVMKALAKKAERRVVASGTVTLGDPRDLYAQMVFLSTALMPEDYLKFQDTFLVRNQYNKHQVLGYKNLHLLNERLDRVATRKKREECLQLPPRQIFDVTFALSAEQKNLYNKLVTEMSADLASMFDEGRVTLDVANKAVLLNKLSQVCSGFILEPIDTGVCNNCPKLAKCVEEAVRPYTTRCTETVGAAPTRQVVLKENPKLALLEELLDQALAEPTAKAIIWAQYTAELDHLEDLLVRKKLEYVRVDGKTGSRVQRNVDHFNTDANCRVYLGQVATGVGITLNAATFMFYYSVDWSLGTYLQSLDRNYRAGQTQRVVVYRLFGADTVELFKAEALEEKEHVSSTLTLSTKMACSLCPQQADCASDGIELFDQGCRYQRSVKRTVAKAKELQ